MTIFKTARPLRRPWPYDIVIDGQGFMLGRLKADPSTPLVSTTVPPLQAQPPEFHYGAQNPTVEQTFAFTDFTGGFGQRYLHQAGDESRYLNAYGVDASIQGQLQIGPLYTVVTPSPTVDSTNGISDFWEQASSGTTKLFALDGRYALVRNGDTATDWTVSKDFGAGNVAQDVIVIKQTGGATTYAFVAVFNSSGVEQNFWHYTGASDTTVWTQHATLTARCWARVSQDTGEFVYRAYSTNKVDRCDMANDPTVAGNWTGAFNIGDATAPIVRLVVHPDGTLYAMKTDGIYVIRSNGTSQKLYVGLSENLTSETGRWNSVWENWIHTTYGITHYRIGPGGTLEPIGPERMVENDSPVRGYITATAPTPYALYAGLYNPDTAKYALLKFGSWVVAEDGEAHRKDAWHGDILFTVGTLTSGKITGMRASTIGAASGHQRLYFGTAAGTITYFQLPCVPNPSACSNYLFYSSGSYAVLYTSYWDGGFPLTTKHFRWTAVSGKRFTVADNASLRVALSESGSYGSIPLGAPVVTTIPGSRFDCAADVTASNASFEIGLLTGSTSSTPNLSGIAFAFGLRQPVTLVYEFSILAEDRLRKRDGSRTTIGAVKIRSLAKAMATAGGSVTTYLPDEVAGGSSMELSIISYEEGIAWDNQTQRWHAAVHLRGVQTAVGAANYGSGSSGFVLP